MGDDILHTYNMELTVDSSDFDHRNAKKTTPQLSTRAASSARLQGQEPPAEALLHVYNPKTRASKLHSSPITRVETWKLQAK